MNQDTVTVPRELLQRMISAIDMLIPTLPGLNDKGRTWLRDEIIESTDALRAVLDAEPAPAQDSRSHVGNSHFEGWFSEYDPSGKGDKQRAQDAYAAGMGDPVYLPAPVQEPVPLLTDEEVSHIAVANAIEFHEFARAIEAAVRQKAGIK